MANLVFDGEYLFLIDGGRVVDGPWVAISGVPNTPYGVSPYGPSNTNLKNIGPTPEGAWQLRVLQQAYNSEDPTSGRGGLQTFPYSDDWGTGRWLLHENDVDLLGRDKLSMFLHGGTVPGSHGCIDLGPNGGNIMQRIFAYARSKGLDFIGLEVDYGHWRESIAAGREHPAFGPAWDKSDIRCFPADTPIQTSLTATTPISDLHIGDVVLAFDPCDDNGRGALVPRRVTKLFRNVTDVWVRLAWVDPVTGDARELVATPGHHFLDPFGNFPPIAEMIRDGGATVVLACGFVVEVVATRIAYSAATADQFERAESVAMSAGNAALAPQPLDGWATYNFEVEDLHTYVAGGVRVHNVSWFTPETSLGNLADQISAQISNHIWGANTLETAVYGSAMSAVTTTAADAYLGRADFNAAHLGGRYMYEVAGGLGAFGGSLLAQDLISGLGIRDTAANDNFSKVGIAA